MVKDDKDRDVFKLKNESNLNNKADIVSQTRKVQIHMWFWPSIKDSFDFQDMKGYDLLKAYATELNRIQSFN